MNNAGQEFSGRSVDEAIAAGLKTLGLRSYQVDVEIIQKGSRGIFGLGSEPAIVRLLPKAIPENSVQKDNLPSDPSEDKSTATPLSPVPSQPIPAQPAPLPIVATALPTNEVVAAIGETEAEAEDNHQDSSAQTGTGEAVATVAVLETKAAETLSTDEEEEAVAVELLSEMLRLMGFEAAITTTWKESEDEKDERVMWIDLQGRNLSALIGRYGETLDDLQYLLRMMVNQRLHRWIDIVIDVDRYRQRRSEQLVQLANRIVDQVMSGKRAIALEPMPPNERRIIHMTLRDHPDVYTQSAGEGERRKVYIVPRS